jgi:hypothetical protein
MMFIKDGHPVVLEDILGWMIISGEDITDIGCFLVGLVTGDNGQYDHGDNSHKRMTGDNWQNDHGDNSQSRETGLSCNRCSGRLEPKANLLIYEVVQGGRCEECLLLQENIMRNKQERTKEFKQQARTSIWHCDMPKYGQKQQHKKVARKESCKEQAQQELARQQVQ